MAKKDKKKDITLRDKKFARTKISLMEEFVSRWNDGRKFEEVSIKEVCDEAMVSEGTFYNYFPHKLDLVSYYMTIHMITVENKIKKNFTKEKESINKINAIFGNMADFIEKNKFFHEMISIFMVENKEKCHKPLHLAEKIQLFPNCENHDAMKEKELEVLLEKWLTGAVENGELPKKTNIEETVFLLVSIMIGVPIAKEKFKKGEIKKMYKRHLKIVFDTLRKE